MLKTQAQGRSNSLTSRSTENFVLKYKYLYLDPSLTAGALIFFALQASSEASLSALLVTVLIQKEIIFKLTFFLTRPMEKLLLLTRYYSVQLIYILTLTRHSSISKKQE